MTNMFLNRSGLFKLIGPLTELSLGIQSPSENGFMEPKYQKRFVSVIRSTPITLTDKVSQDP